MLSQFTMLEEILYEDYLVLAYIAHQTSLKYLEITRGFDANLSDCLLQVMGMNHSSLIK